MKRTMIFLALILALVLTACGSDATETPAAPTPVPPTEEPEVEEVQPTAETVMVIPDELLSTTWAWNGFSGPEGQEIVVDPQNYTLTFREDGTVAILADCNNAFASFTIADNSLTMVMGPMTMAQCLPESRSDVFLSYLASAAKYFFEDGNFFIELLADGGTMAFLPLATVVADDGGGALDGSLMANDWMWVSFVSPVEQITIETPQSYHLTFQEDGLLEIVADCNNAHANYVGDASSISINVGPMTLAACPAGSRSDDFINYLGSAAKYFFEDGDLFIDLLADGGTMQFSPFDDSEVESGRYEDPYYIVGKGDTLYSIGVRFGVPWQDIAAVNGIQGTLIYVGQHLLIPDENTVIPEPAVGERVTFQPGTISDTRQGIINQGAPKSYVLRAQSGQTMTISTETSGEPLVISVGNTNGDLLPLQGTNSQLKNSVSAVLPESTDYIVTVRATTLPENPQLAFTITFTIQ